MSHAYTQTTTGKRPRFWARQFAADSTPAQDKFDAIFAIIMPILVLAADPFVFKGGIFGRSLLEDYQLIAYVISTVEIGFFLGWRTFRKRVSKFAAVFGGLFLVGATFSAVIGLLILPYSVFGLMALIGALGFTPFFTAFVFLRNGIRAMKVQINHSSSEWRFLATMLGGVLLMGLPVLASIHIENAIAASVNTLVSGNVVEATQAADRLKWFGFVPDKYRNDVAEAYGRESDPSKRAVLNQAYRQMAGDDIDVRYQMLAD
jgi:hypothetical protein